MKPAAGEECGEDGEVGGHGEVFEDQDGQHGGCFAVAEPAEVADDLGGDAGGGDVGDAAHGDGGDGSPAEDEGGQDAGGGVEGDVDEADGC